MQASYLKFFALSILAKLASADSNWKWSVEDELQLGLDFLTFPVNYRQAQHMEMWGVVQDFSLMALKAPSIDGRVKTSILPDENGKQYLQVDFTLDGNDVKPKHDNCKKSGDGVTCSSKVEVNYLWPMDVTVQSEAFYGSYSVILNNAGKSTQVGLISVPDQVLGLNSDGSGSLVEDKDTCPYPNAVIVDVLAPKSSNYVTALTGKIETPTQADRCKDNLQVIYSPLQNGYKIFEFSK